MNSGTKPGEVFAFFNEVTIIDQLVRSLVSKILPDDVHPSHFAIILHLTRIGDGKTPLSLASAMQVTKATMSHSLKVLEKRGFIQTLPSETDARSKNVYITEAGWTFHDTATEALGRAFKQFLNDEHRQIMSDTLPGLIAVRNLLHENRAPLQED